MRLGRCMATVVKLRDMVGWDLRKGKHMMFWDHMMICCVSFLFHDATDFNNNFLSFQNKNSKQGEEWENFTKFSWKVREIHNLTTAGTPSPPWVSSWKSSRLILGTLFASFGMCGYAAYGVLFRGVRCGVLDPNRDLMSLVWRAGPQPRYCKFSVACWTPTAIVRVQCGVLDPNRDIACWVWRAGPQKEWSKK